MPFSSLIYPWIMVIFYSYVSLPEANIYIYTKYHENLLFTYPMNPSDTELDAQDRNPQEWDHPTFHR